MVYSFLKSVKLRLFWIRFNIYSRTSIAEKKFIFFSLSHENNFKKQSVIADNEENIRSCTQRKRNYFSTIFSIGCKCINFKELREQKNIHSCIYSVISVYIPLVYVNREPLHKKLYNEQRARFKARNELYTTHYTLNHKTGLKQA